MDFPFGTMDCDVSGKTNKAPNVTAYIVPSIEFSTIARKSITGSTHSIEEGTNAAKRNRHLTSSGRRIGHVSSSFELPVGKSISRFRPRIRRGAKTDEHEANRRTRTLHGFSVNRRKTFYGLKKMQRNRPTWCKDSPSIARQSYHGYGKRASLTISAD
jgi:hypothetical protein